MGKIISIHSFRGGTGKSNVCANLAAQAAMAGYRVCLIDTDIQSPGVHVLFGLDDAKMGHTLNEFLRGACPIDQAALNIGEHTGSQPGCMNLVGKNMWLVPSSINSREISKVLKEGYDVNLLNQGLKSLMKGLKLDYLFIDTHPGLNEETLLSIIISDVLLIIVRPDQQDFQGTAVTVDVARSLDVANMYLIVNKALTRYDFNQVRQEVEDKFSVPVAGVLPLTEDMADLGSSDIFSLRNPKHDWSRAIREITKNALNIG